jgi:hypothetical protein
MKRNMPRFLTLVTIVLTACSSAPSVPLQKSITTSATPDIASSFLTPTTPFPENVADFTQSEPDTWVMLMPAVQEYFYYRKQAVVTGNIKVLWERYPALQNGADISKGINAEQSIIASYETLKPFDGNIFPEEYEHIKVKWLGDKAEVLVHGTELYLWRDTAGNFTNSGGEFKVILFLEKRNNRWHVYRTDEVTMAEWHDFSP